MIQGLGLTGTQRVVHGRDFERPEIRIFGSNLTISRYKPKTRIQARVKIVPCILLRAELGSISWHREGNNIAQPSQQQ